MEIVAGVHQLQIPFPEGIRGDTNVYVVEGNEGSILIDTGWDSPDGLKAFIQGLEWDRLKLRDIKQIVVTHIHPDHYGLAGKVKELCGAKIAMHKLEGELINLRYVNFEELLRKVEAELFSYGVPMGELSDFAKASLWMREFVSPEAPEVVLDGGDEISNGAFNLEVLHTPGHSPGHICLREPMKGWLFCGDLVLYNSFPHVGLHPQSGDNPLGDYMDSLKKVQNRSVNFVFPGHGSVFNSLKLRIEDIVRHREQRNVDIIEALNGDLKTIYQIATEIPWKVESGGVAFEDLGIWDKRLAVRETAAHIRLLALQDKIGKIDKHGVSSFLVKD